MTWNKALVTGASSGMGLAFAEQLAARGTGLVLVARSAPDLDGLARRLRDSRGVSAEVLAADLTAEDDVARVADRLADDSDPVDLLVNDAGIGTIGPLTELPLSRSEQVLRLNALAVLSLTRAAMDSMRDRGGTILNMASLAGYAPVPYFAVYAASKAFVLAFTLAVREELRGSGVSVTALSPGFVDTDFADRAGVRDAPLRWLWADPERVVQAGLDGAARGRAVVLPGAAVQAASVAVRLLPPSLFARVGAALGRTLAEGFVEDAADEASREPLGPPPEQRDQR